MKADVDAVVLGSGFAGCTAAIYLARYGRSVIVMSGPMPGGQLTITTEVENFPGFEEPILGPKLMEDLIAQSKRVGAIFKDGISAKALSKQDGIFCVDLSSDGFINSKAVIVATGASAKWLGIPGESEYLGRGVSGCATCDGYFFRDKKVCVIGGGNTAAQEAIHLSSLAREVLIIHRRDQLRADVVLQKSIASRDNIFILYDKKLLKIIGNNTKVVGIDIQDVKSGNLKSYEMNGVFIAIGHQPNTSFLNNFLNLDEDGYINTKAGSSLTEIEGVFAAGDVCDKLYKQAVTAAGSGCMAAIDAEHYLSQR